MFHKRWVAALTGALAMVLVLPAGTASAEDPDPGVKDRLPTRLEQMAGALSSRWAATDLAPDAGTISWHACNRKSGLQGSRAQCGTVKAPLDHNDPNGPQVSLAVSRIRHQSSAAKYQGVMLLNPGGPGVSGVEYASLNMLFPSSISRAYDWIGFDPRGVGQSTPRVTCDSGFFGYDRPNYFPKPKKNLKRWLKRSKNYALDCDHNNGDILEHMTTVDSAYDMDAIRTALGVPQINYYGYSYGTYLGQVYSTLFPTHVRRQVLDSNVDANRAFYRANLDQDIAFQKNLDAWFGWIGKHDSAYGLGASKTQVSDLFSRTMKRLDRHPAAGKIGPDEWIDAFLEVGYSQSRWTHSAEMFAGYVHRGRTRPLIAAYKESATPGDDNSFAVYNAVQCTDAPWPKHWSTWSKDNWATYRKAPLTTWMNTWFNAPCLYWPVPSGARFDVDGSAAPKTLLVGETLDGATPFAGSLLTRRLFPRASLIAIKGGRSHANTPDGNPCVDKRIYDYLRNGKLPKRKSGNRPDVTCRNIPFYG